VQKPALYEVHIVKMVMTNGIPFTQVPMHTRFSKNSGRPAKYFNFWCTCCFQMLLASTM